MARISMLAACIALVAGQEAGTVDTILSDKNVTADAPLQCYPVGHHKSPKHNGKLPEGASCAASGGNYCCDDGLQCTSAVSHHRSPCGITAFGEHCSCTRVSARITANVPVKAPEAEAPLHCQLVGPDRSPKKNGHLPEGAFCMMGAGAYSTWCCDAGLKCTSAASHHRKSCGMTTFGESCSCTPVSVSAPVDMLPVLQPVVNVPAKALEAEAPLHCQLVDPDRSPKKNGHLPEGAFCMMGAGAYSTWCCDAGLKCTSAASHHRKPCGMTTFGESCSCTRVSVSAAVDTLPPKSLESQTPLQCETPDTGKLPRGANCVAPYTHNLATYCCADGLQCTSAASHHTKQCGPFLAFGEHCSCTVPVSKGLIVV